MCRELLLTINYKAVLTGLCFNRLSVVLIGIKVDGQLVCKANGKNKKSAQKNASRKAFEKLNLKIEGAVGQ